jgi:penicillin amidase
MRNFLLLPFILLWIGCTTSENPFPTEEINVKGLQQSVEIFRDQWGVNHIYAQNQNDLFFAQGYATAQDRLFQFEVWRRQATGTVAEILGSGRNQKRCRYPFISISWRSRSGVKSLSSPRKSDHRSL